MFLHIDMNSYFATVEQQANPLLRGKALGVCAYLQPRGCIIAASIEAKARGMKVGMRVDEAKKIIPDAVFVENDPSKYYATTSRIIRIFQDVTDRMEQYSIDEAFLDLSGWARDEAEASWIAIRIRERIRKEVGEWLSCSIGIAPTRFLAKLASDLEKPSGLIIITPENLEEKLAGMELSDVYGIGRRMKSRIEALGYRTPLELKRAPVANLMQAFGINGYMLWAHLNGIDLDDLEDSSAAPKSIGHSYCIPGRPEIQKRARVVFAKLAEKAARRLRRYDLLARSVSVGIALRSAALPYHHPWSREGLHHSVHLDEPVSDTRSLVRASLRVLDGLWDGNASLSFMAVTFSDFVPPSNQISIFEDTAEYTLSKIKSANRDPRISDLRSLISNLDMINDKYGERTIAYGTLFGLEQDDAPDRIGFRKIDGVDVSNIALNS